MPLSRDSKAEKKLKALRRAEFRLKQRFEYIDWEDDVLYPEIEDYKAGRPILGLEAGAVFDLKVADAHTRLGDPNGLKPEPASGDSRDPAGHHGPPPPDEGA